MIMFTGFRSIADNRGFTLIEITVATAIASLIMVLLYSSYQSTFKSIKRMSGHAEFYENINLAISKINRDISNAYFNRDNKDISFIGNVVGESSTIHFVTINHCDYNIRGDMREASPYSDVREVGYFLKEDPDPVIQDLYFLMKREDLHFDDEPESGGIENALLVNVKELKFEFRQQNDWTDRWDSRRDYKFPEAVRTTLTVKNYNGKEETYVFISTTNIKP